MSTTFSQAPDVRRVAEELIPKHHGNLLEMGVMIEYLFMDPPPKKNGRLIWGQARKLSGLTAYLCRRLRGEGEVGANRPLFLMLISEEIWDGLKQAQKIALVDHELCHFRADMDEEENVLLSLAGHDLEEFACIVKRHGLWAQDVKVFAETIRQLDLGLVMT